MAYSKNDPRVAEIKKHITQLSRRFARPIVVADYREYKANQNAQLPTVDTLIQMFGSWDNLLKECGIDPKDGAKDLSRTPDDVLIKSLHDAAEDLGTNGPSSHAYDRWRTEFIASGKRWTEKYADPPSSSLIRKWLGFWDDCLQAAGLESQNRSGPRKASTKEIIEALNQVKSGIDGMLTPTAYEQYRSENDESLPPLDEIYSSFTSWDVALRTADIEQSDALHPEGLWSAEECRRIAKQSEIILGEPLNEDNYQIIVEKSRTPKPSWQVLQELLRQ